MRASNSEVNKVFGFFKRISIMKPEGKKILKTLTLN